MEKKEITLDELKAMESSPVTADSLGWDFQNKSEEIGIAELELAYTDASDKPILVSYGARSCIIVAAHNPYTKQTALAHMDMLTTMSSLEDMFYQIRGQENEVEVHLAGQVQGMEEYTTAQEILDMINRLNFLTLKTASIGKQKPSEALAIDARTGKIATIFSIEDVNIPSSQHIYSINSHNQRYDLNLVFDGRQHSDSEIYSFLHTSPSPRHFAESAVSEEYKDSSAIPPTGLACPSSGKSQKRSLK